MMVSHTRPTQVTLTLTIQFALPAHARAVGIALVDHCNRADEQQDIEMRALFLPVYREALRRAPDLPRPDVCILTGCSADEVALRLSIDFIKAEHAEIVAQELARQLNESEEVQDAARGLLLGVYNEARCKTPGLDMNPAVIIRTELVP